MDILLYNKALQLAIGPGLAFPDQDELKDAGLPEDGCSIDEWRTYFVKFYSDDFPEWFESRRLPQPLLSHPLPKNICAFNFKNYVGLSRIGSIKLNVANKKIGNKTYHAMLDDIAERYADLVFSFSDSSVGQNYVQSGDPGRNLAYVEYLFLKRFLLDQQEDLSAISAAIASNPHRLLQREDENRSIESIRFVDPFRLMNSLTAGQNMASLPAGHPLLETPLSCAIRGICSQRLFPTAMREEQKTLSLDTQENRFVRHLLEDVRKRLEDLKTIILPGAPYLNPDIEENLEEMSFHVNAFLDEPMWREVGLMGFIPKNSQVLQRRDGYRQLFQLFSLLQLLTRYNFPDVIDFENLLETKDVATLYEYWCFFLVKEVLDQRGQRIVDMQKIKHDDDKEAKLVEGCQIEYAGGIRLLFNWTAVPRAKSYSLAYRPDIVVAIGDKKLILDAKYKGRNGENEGFYGDSDNGTISSWKEEDIGKMHTYRDAIKNVDGAFALYPGATTNGKTYPAFDAKHKFQGVGALPLKPDESGGCNTDHFKRLRDLIKNFADSQLE